MNFALTNEEQSFVRSLRAYLDGLDTAEVVGEMEQDEWEIGPAGQGFIRRLGRDGWLGVGWPVEHGGKGRSPIEEWLFAEEMSRRRLPYGPVTLSIVGPTIMRVGTADQKRRYLPEMLRGSIQFALGYTEPNAGSDLASLETRAVRDGDEYVINGHKVFTTGAHYATHIWLAVRTGAPGSRSRGISVLIVPTATPGITVRPIGTQPGTRTNEVFFDDVRVPAENLVGAENDGWSTIAVALDFERSVPASDLARDVEGFLRWASAAGDDVLSDRCARESLARLTIDVEVARLFGARMAWLNARGAVATTEAAVNKVWYSERRQEIASEILSLLGERGQLGPGSPGAPADGAFEHAYRFATMFKFAGGANEVQRNIIAQHGLRLPR